MVYYLVWFGCNTKGRKFFTLNTTSLVKFFNIFSNVPGAYLVLFSIVETDFDRPLENIERLYRFLKTLLKKTVPQLFFLITFLRRWILSTPLPLWCNTQKKTKTKSFFIYTDHSYQKSKQKILKVYFVRCFRLF